MACACAILHAVHLSSFVHSVAVPTFCQNRDRHHLILRSSNCKEPSTGLKYLCFGLPLSQPLTETPTRAGLADRRKPRASIERHRCHHVRACLCHHGLELFATQTPVLLRGALPPYSSSQAMGQNTSSPKDADAIRIGKRNGFPSQLQPLCVCSSCCRPGFICVSPVQASLVRHGLPLTH